VLLTPGIKKPLRVFDSYSATVFWLHAHQTAPLNSSDISSCQKIAVCDWTPTQRLLDKSCFKGETLNLNACKCQKTAALDWRRMAAAFLDSYSPGGDNQIYDDILPH
jgi:hypothetical protein